HTCGSGDSGCASGTLYRYRGEHESSSTAAAVQTLEVVDAYGAGTLGDCSSQWSRNVLRMVCGAIPVIPGPGTIFAHMSVRGDRQRRFTEGKNAGANHLRAHRAGCNAGYSVLFRIR